MSGNKTFKAFNMHVLESAIEEQVDWIGGTYESTDLAKDLANIPIHTMCNIFQASLARALEKPTGLSELCQLLENLDLFSDNDGVRNVTLNRLENISPDRLHISNVPRIKELANHTFSTLQKGFDIY